MANWKFKVTAGVLGGLGRYMARNASQKGKEIDNYTSKNPFNAKEANPANEDEYMRNYRKKKRPTVPVPPQKPETYRITPLQKDVSSWSEDDLKEVMSLDDYKNDGPVRKKVKSYFDHKYPGPQRFDATGRPINN